MPDVRATTESPTGSAFIDSHAHLDAPQLDGAALATTLAAARALGWRGAVLAGYGPEELVAAAARCADHAGLWYAAGLHPWWLADNPQASVQQAAFAAMAAAVAAGEIVAVGELGLDVGVRGAMPLVEQAVWFERGLSLARDARLPAIVHVVGAWPQAIAALSRFAGPRLGILHRYGGSAAMVARLEGLGLHISLSPHHLRRSPERARAVARVISPDRLLVETDWTARQAPYVEAVAGLNELLTRLATWRSVQRSVLAGQILANTAAIYDIAVDQGEQP